MRTKVRGYCTQPRISALVTYEQLKHIVTQVHEGSFKPSISEFVHLLHACGDSKCPSLAKCIHSAVEKSHKEDLLLQNHVINMYLKSGCLSLASTTFEKLQVRNVFSWTLMITAYAQKGHTTVAIKLFQRMQHEGSKPNHVTFAAILSALNNPSHLRLGRQLQTHARETCLESDIVLKNTIVCMYGRCGSLEEARREFERTAETSIASWNGLITVYTQWNRLQDATETYTRMLLEGLQPDRVTFVTVLGASKSLATARLIHSHSSEAGFDDDIFVGNAVISVYAKLASFEDVMSKFRSMKNRDVVSWTATIGACPENAVRLFREMQHSGVKPNDVTFINVLSSCRSLQVGNMVHYCAAETGLSKSSVVVGSGLIAMYARCASLEDALHVFRDMETKNSYSWTSMISAYGVRGETGCGFRAYRAMQLEGVRPDKVTFVTVLDICSSKTALVHGKLIHRNIVESGERITGTLASSLLSMYGRCGSVTDAKRVFRNGLSGTLRVNHTSVWNALVSAYAQGGHAREALESFLQMVNRGVVPDALTFTSVLAACSYVGSVEDCHGYFFSMVGDYGITPCVEHYGCLVDVLCKSGKLGMAEDVMEQVPAASGSKVSWLTLLSACKIHKDVMRAQRAAQRIVKLEGSCSAVYALLAGACSDGEMSSHDIQVYTEAV